MASEQRLFQGRQNPVPPVNIPIPTKIGSKMGGEFTHPSKWDPKTVFTTVAIFGLKSFDTGNDVWLGVPSPLRLAATGRPSSRVRAWARTLLGLLRLFRLKVFHLRNTPPGKRRKFPTYTSICVFDPWKKWRNMSSDGFPLKPREKHTSDGKWKLRGDPRCTSNDPQGTSNDPQGWGGWISAQGTNEIEVPETNPWAPKAVQS